MFVCNALGKENLLPPNASVARDYFKLKTVKTPSLKRAPNTQEGCKHSDLPPNHLKDIKGCSRKEAITRGDYWLLFSG